MSAGCSAVEANQVRHICGVLWRGKEETDTLFKHLRACEGGMVFQPFWIEEPQASINNDEMAAVAARFGVVPQNASYIVVYPAYLVVLGPSKEVIANLTTFSNEERLKKEGPPYCEIMVKATAEGPLEKRLWEHVRSCGYGPWVSVTTSEKGSYRQADVLAFLDRHLPKVDEQRSRRWRIIMADDYSAHPSPQVFALCWSRRYVFIPHGGGVTPVAQTPDTDLNQHVNRKYTDRETGDLLRQMRDGIVVPQLRQEECIDIMVDVLSNMELHLNAAKGYLKTSMTVDLGGLQDQEIMR